MARTVKTNGIYKVTCALTGHTSGTNPKVFEARAKLFGVDVKVLKDNYVCRTARKYLTRLVENGKSVNEAVETIRNSYKVARTDTLNENVIKHVLEDVGRGSLTAEQKKAQEMRFAEGCKHLDAMLAKVKSTKGKGDKEAAAPAPEAPAAPEADAAPKEAKGAKPKAPNGAK